MQCTGVERREYRGAAEHVASASLPTPHRPAEASTRHKLKPTLSTPTAKGATSSVRTVWCAQWYGGFHSRSNQRIAEAPARVQQESSTAMRSSKMLLSSLCPFRHFFSTGFSSTGFSSETGKRWRSWRDPDGASTPHRAERSSAAGLVHPRQTPCRLLSMKRPIANSHQGRS